MLERNSGRDITGYRGVIVFEKLCFENVFRPRKRKANVFKFLKFGLKIVLEKLRFRDRLVDGRPNHRNRELSLRF